MEEFSEEYQEYTKQYPTLISVWKSKDPQIFTDIASALLDQPIFPSALLKKIYPLQIFIEFASAHLLIILNAAAVFDFSPNLISKVVPCVAYQVRSTMHYTRS